MLKYQYIPPHNCGFRIFLGGGFSISGQWGNSDISDVLPVHALVRLWSDSSDVPTDRQHGSRV